MRGMYIYGDYIVGTIWGMRYENGKVIESAKLLEQPKNIGGFAQDADGEIYMLSVNDGRILTIVPAEKAKAVTPLAAMRSISLAARGGSHMGINMRGM